MSNVWARVDSLRYLLQGTPLLSGNFFELRETHFHAGLDFKTGGKEGLPVIYAKDGVFGSCVRVADRIWPLSLTREALLLCTAICSDLCLVWPGW